MEKGDKIKIDRFIDGEILEYTILRKCHKHVNVRCPDGSSWAMPNNRIKDIIK